MPQDDAEAVKWYRLAAEQGHAGAQYDLGLIYDNGEGVVQDQDAALKWYRMAADQGHAWAQSNLGIKYAEGQGVPQDYVRAYMWWNLAAAKGDAGALTNRGTIAKEMTPAQIAKAEKLAREWAAKHGGK